MPVATLAILIVAQQDDAIIAMLRELRHLGYLLQLQQVSDASDMTKALNGQDWDLVVADYELDGFDGVAALQRLQQLGLDIPFIMVSKEESQYSAVASLRSGAVDYISRHSLGRLIPAVERGVKLAEGRRDKQRVEEALAQNERFIRSTLDSLPTQVAILNQDGIVVYTNRAWRVFANEQYPSQVAGDMLGVDYFKFCRFYDRGGDEGRTSVALAAGIERIIAGQSESFSQEFAWKSEEGTCWLELQATPFAGGGPMRAVLAVNDVTDRKYLEQKLLHLSAHDSLTAVYNRAYFEVALQEYSHLRYMPVGIVNCDVNGLKLINDTFGSETGDIMLGMAAEILRAVFPETSVIARTGGDEFSVLLPNTSAELVDRYCQQVRLQVLEYNQRNNGDSRGVNLSLSMGHAVGGGSLERVSECMREAENAMQREKLHSGQSARSALVSTVKKLLEVRDFQTGGHATRMIDACEQMARLLNLSDERIADIRLLAQFHDIGKVGIPDHILFKSGPLTDEEFMIMKRHSDIGHRIALSSPELLPIAESILQHHEWWDGSGYPLGVKGTDIPLECRILSIVDAYDAMTSERPYRQPLSHDAALAEVCRNAGRQFDPDLVELFMELQQDG